jgi:hypothetical protein
MVQEFNCGQMCVSGFSSHYEFVLEAGAKVELRSDEIPLCGAKTVTNNLPLLSVLWARPCLFVSATDSCLGLRIFLFVFVLL